MGALIDQTAEELSGTVSVDSTILTMILDAAEKKFWAVFDEHADKVLFHKKILFWSITITLGTLRPQIQALFDLLEPEPIAVS